MLESIHALGTMFASAAVCGGVCGYAYANVGTMLVVFAAMPASMPMPVSAQCPPEVVFMAMPMMHPSVVVCGCAYEYVGIVPASTSNIDSLAITWGMELRCPIGCPGDSKISQPYTDISQNHSLGPHQGVQDESEVTPRPTVSTMLTSGSVSYAYAYAHA